MSRTPTVNPDVNDIADRAKFAYATGTKALAGIQYRLGELAGTGRLDPEESMSLQEHIHSIWEALYSGTAGAVRDWDDPMLDRADNTYSDGRPVVTQIRNESSDVSDVSWEHNRFMLADGAINEHPLGTVCYIAHPDRSAG